jgi:hypothetical protein
MTRVFRHQMRRRARRGSLVGALCPPTASAQWRKPMALVRGALARPISFLRHLADEDAVEALARQHREVKRGFSKAAIPGLGRRQNFERLVRQPAIQKRARKRTFIRLLGECRPAAPSSPPSAATRRKLRRGCSSRSFGSDPSLPVTCGA